LSNNQIAHYECESGEADDIPSSAVMTDSSCQEQGQDVLQTLVNCLHKESVFVLINFLQALLERKMGADFVIFPTLLGFI
jgi:hypothetical protein